MPNAPSLPHRPVTGSRECSSSRLNTITSCWMKFFNAYKRPHPDGGEGWETLSTPTYWIEGGAFHIGAEAYARSGWKDGEDTGQYILEAAIEAARANMKDRLEEFPHEDEFHKSWVVVEGLLQRNHEWKGPDGHGPSWPTIQIVGNDKGEPLLEQEFHMDLGHGDWTLVVIPDQIITRSGYLSVREFKTSAVSRAKTVLKAAKMNGQFAAEDLVLHSLYPDSNIYGVLVEIHVKGMAKKRLDARESPIMEDVVTHDEMDLQLLGHNVRMKIDEMEYRLGQYEERTKKGITPSRAALEVFSRDGLHNGSCDGCPYVQLCRFPGTEEQKARSFKPRRERRK